MKRTLLLYLLVAGCGASPTGLQPHQPARVLGAIDQGPLDRSQKIEFLVGLKPRDPVGIVQLLGAQAQGLERAVSPLTFAERFGSTADDYQRVLDWARENNLEVLRTVDGRSTVTLRGDVADVERAFGTRIHQWSDASGSFYAPMAIFQSPFRDIFAGVVGLDDASRWYSQRHDPGPVPPDATCGQNPCDLRSRYQFPTTAGKLGEGETIGILGTGYPPSNTPCSGAGCRKIDVPGWAQSSNGGACSGVQATNTVVQYQQVFVGGPNRDPDGLANNEYGENLLDVDMALGLAPAANVIHVFTATNSPGLFSDGITFFVNQVPQAHAVSVSFGTCERVAVTEMAVLNNLFQQAKAQGQQWFFASGDNGTDACRDGKPNQVISVNWPSSSPYVISVGGTQLGGNGANPTTGETVWGGAGAGGGGQSEIIAKPAYQMGVGPYPNDGVRDQPDVAALAGGPGVCVYAQGQTFPSEGTSAATPMWAAVWAILDEVKGGGAGITNAHERIYQLAGVGFNDITAGNNSDAVTPGYPGLVGYDLATGWGSPNVTALVGAW